MYYQYVSMDRIFSKLIREVFETFSEDDIIEFTGEALEFIHTSKAYEPFVAFIEVKNHQCAIPKGTHGIVQVARNNTWTGTDCNAMCPSNVISALTSPSSSSTTDCAVTVDSNPCAFPYDDALWLDCTGKPIVAYDLAYYRPYFDLKLESFGTFSNTSYYRSAFTPIRLSTNSMFNSLVCNNDGASPYFNSRTNSNVDNSKFHKDEYSIVQKSFLRFSFENGAIALAYLKQMTDPNTGYPMIPDTISHTTAIVKYITMKTFERQFYDGRQGAQAKMEKAEQDWHWYCAQASNNEKMPNGEDEHQNLLDQRQRLLPNTNSYYGFFGNLNEPEHRVWNNRFGINNNSIFRGDGVSGLYS